MAKILKRNDKNKTDKISMKFDVPMLNALIKYMQCEFVSPVDITNLYKLMSQINIDEYNYNQDIQYRMKMILMYIEARLNNSIKDNDVLQSFINNKDTDIGKFILEESPLQKNMLTSSECKNISGVVTERLQSVYIYKVKDDIINLLEKMNDTSLVSYYDIIKSLKEQITALNVKLQSASVNNGLIKSFNFSGDDFARLLNIVVDKAKKPSSILQTGIRQLNSVLSPGFHSTRLYVFLGGTGKFKSGTLLNIADQIRRYNPQIIPVEDGLRKTILFVSLENTVEETVTRLFDMYSGEDDTIYDLSYEEILRILRDNGNFKFSDSEGIDIDIYYYANMEIKTSDIYTLINKLMDDGKKVICVILDYLLRIDSVANHYGDERLRVSYATKEMKSLAQYFEMPVISAMQINRDGNSIIDAAMRENKQDVAQYVGASSVGIAWDVIQESDWVGLVNPELQRSTNKLYLTCKRLKIRYKKDPFSVDYFNHPFSNNKNIRLAIDIDQEKPLSIMSLASDLQSISDKEIEKVNNSRPRINTHANKNNSVLQSINLPSLAVAHNG